MRDDFFFRKLWAGSLRTLYLWNLSRSLFESFYAWDLKNSLISTSPIHITYTNVIFGSLTGKVEDKSSVPFGNDPLKETCAKQGRNISPLYTLRNFYVMFLNLNINWTNTRRLSNISWYCCNHVKQGAKFQICYYYYITITIIIINLNITFFVQRTVNGHRGR